MSISSQSTVSAPGFGAVARLALAPLRLIDGFFQSILAANRFAHDVEFLSMSSDAKLARIGLKRETLVADLAARSGLFRVD